MLRRRKLLAEFVCLAILGMIILIGVSATSYINQNPVIKGVLAAHRRIMKLPGKPNPFGIQYCETFIFPRKLSVICPLIKDIVIENKLPNVDSTMKLLLGGVDKCFVHIRLCEKAQRGFSYEIKIFTYDKYDSY